MRSIHGLTAATSTGGSRAVDGTGRPHGRQQGEVVELALDRQRRAACGRTRRSASRPGRTRAAAAPGGRTPRRSGVRCAPAPVRPAPGGNGPRSPRPAPTPSAAVTMGLRGKATAIPVSTSMSAAVGDRAAGEVRRAPRLGHDQAGQPGRRGPPAELRRLAQAAAPAPWRRTSAARARRPSRLPTSRRHRRRRPPVGARTGTQSLVEGSTPRSGRRCPRRRSGTPWRPGCRRTRCPSSSASGGCRRPAGRPDPSAPASAASMSWSTISK